MQYSNILLATLFAVPLSYAQTQAADGLIVPFTSALPLCASLCGPLYDVQGKCTPPVTTAKDESCFCSDARLRLIGNGASGVSSVCGATACPVAADAEKITSWFKNFCSNQIKASTTAKGGASSTSTGTSAGTAAGGNNRDSSWFATHRKWVIMIIVVTVGIIAIWVGAWFLRKRYLLKREREIEMSPPVAWGPNQVAAGGYTDGVMDARGAQASGPGGHYKEATAMATPAGSKLKKQKMAWFTSNKA